MMSTDRARRTPLYAEPSGLPERFRVVVVSPPAAARWIREFVRLASSESWIALDVLPVLDVESSESASVPPDVRAMLAIERLRFRSSKWMLDPVPIVSRGLDQGVADEGRSFNATSLRKDLESMRPDMVIMLGAKRDVEELCLSESWACFRLDPNIADTRAAGVPLLEPVLRREHATAVELVLQRDDGPPILMETSWGSTKLGFFHLQLEDAFRKMPALLLRLIRRIASDQIDLPRNEVATLRLLEPPEFQDSFAGARALTVALPHRAHWQWRNRQSDQPWFVALRSGASRLDPEDPDADANTLIESPSGTYWADPFAVSDSGRTLLFVEEVTLEKPRGVIVCIELFKDGNAVRLGVALEEPWHLSYPQPFNWEGQWYMTVESKAAQRVSLYRAEAFPLRWTHFVDLIEGRKCVDPTLHHQEGHWYLFANVSESGGSACDELFLFVSEDLCGPFRPHPGNPVLSDVRRARPAGRLFTHGGRLIRPAQDCARSYGSAIVFNEVLELSPTRYVERPLSRLDLFPGFDGCHTYNAIDEMEVIDARGEPPSDMPRVVVLDADSEYLESP